MTNLGLRAYVKKLETQDQIKLKSYVAMKFGKSYLTINDKVAGRRSFTATELLALQTIVENEAWRQ